VHVFVLVLSFLLVLYLTVSALCFASCFVFTSSFNSVQLRSLREDGNSGGSKDYSDLYRKSRRGSLGDVDTRSAMEADLRQIYTTSDKATPITPTQASRGAEVGPGADDGIEQPRLLTKQPSGKPVKLKDLRR
jgi:hypothetical protein